MECPVYQVISVETKPYQDQKPGTSGLRKKTSVFLNSPHYTENFVQSTLNALKKSDIIVVGGDGREYTDRAIQIIIKICLANKVKRLVVAKNGLLSTPTASFVIKSRRADGGFILTASHNPGGKDGDFGIKFNDSNGAPAPEEFTDKIYENTLKISSYYEAKDLEYIRIDEGHLLKAKKGDDLFDMEIEIFDSVEEYYSLANELFALSVIRDSMKSSSTHLVDTLHGVMGPYVTEILCNKLGMPSQYHLHAPSLPDFGGLHPDPNLFYAKELVEKIKNSSQLTFGIAFDGDGDRNMVIGEKGFFVTPSDALAVIAANSIYIKAFWTDKFQFNPDKSRVLLKGVARSMPTAPAVDRYAHKHKLLVFETPTGWKYFCNLFEAGRISICGEESFGLGADHIREKDGMWACLSWLSIMAMTKKTVKQLVEDYWREYGRDYFIRYDYENVESDLADKYIDKVESLINSSDIKGKKIGSKFEVELADNWEYVDPVTKRASPNQGYRFILGADTRVVVRLSGTGSSGTTIRMYFNSYSEKDIFCDPKEYLEDLIQGWLVLSDAVGIIKREKPTVIT